jgi:hypothetical protein
VAYLAIALSVFVLSCGKSVQVERQSGQVGSGNAAAYNLSAGIPSVCQEVQDQSISTDGISGIIAMMQKSLLDSSQSHRKVCLQCQPRELKRTKCFDVDVGPLEAVCRNNELEARARGIDINVVCKSGQDKNETKEVRFDLKPNRLEQVISNLPILAYLVKTQVLPKLESGSKRHLVALSAFDFAMNHAKPVLLGQGFDPAADFLVAKAEALRKLTNNGLALTDTQKGVVRQTALKLFGDLSTIAAKSDSISPNDLASLSAAIFVQVPELKPYGFVLPLLFSDGGEQMLPPADMIASIVQGLLPQQPAAGEGAGSAGLAR